MATQVLGLFFMFIALTHASAPDNRGKEFLVTFGQNSASSQNDELFITTSRTTTVNVQVSSPKWTSPSISSTFTVTSGVVKQLFISNALRNSGTTKSTKAILISADDEVVVYGLNREIYSVEAYCALPTDVLGTEYYAHTYYPAPSSYYLQIQVVGVTDGTEVGIKLAGTTGVTVVYNGVTYSPGSWLNLTMDRYDTFQMQTKGDISGTFITSSQPVGLFSGTQRTNIGRGTSSDHLVEMSIPVKNWGKRFVLVPIPDRTTGDYFRFVASEDDTVVHVQSVRRGVFMNDTFTIAQAGQTALKLYESERFSYVTSNKAILIAQFSLSQVTEEADPSMLLIPAVEQYAADYTFSTPKYSYGSYINYFMFVVDKSLKDGLRMDGNALSANTAYIDIPGTTFVGGYINIPDGSHTVRHISPISVFGGFLFGRARYEAYGFPTGLRMAPINQVCVPTSSTIGDGIDNDCDGRIDEEICTIENKGKDDDNDGAIDEDCSRPTPIDGNWDAWEPWSSCQCIGGSSSNGGSQSRQRTCTNPVPKYDGKQCAGDSSQTQSCTPNANCAVDGSWALWGAWSSCSATCGGGTFSRSRTCTNPAPVNGADCVGSGTSTGTCNPLTCPINGNWGSWSQFGDCSNSCGAGQANRSRTCDNPAPSYGGLVCTGDTIEYQTCTGACIVDGNWGDWQSWGACTKTCDSGIRGRSRVCNNPSPANGGKSCDGRSAEEDACNTSPCPTAAAGAYVQRCPNNFFTCRATDTYSCVPLDAKCDCEDDCGGNSDEDPTYAGCDPAAAALCAKAGASDIQPRIAVVATMFVLLLSCILRH